MRKMKHILLGIIMIGMSACQPEYTGWLSQLPDEVEKARKPVKPTSLEIPVTRPDESQRNEWQEIADGVYGFSWKILSHYYQQKRGNLLFAPQDMIQSLNKKMLKKGEEGQLRLLKALHLTSDLEYRLGIFANSMNDFVNHPDLFSACTRMSYVTDSDEEGNVSYLLSFKGPWRKGFDAGKTYKAVFHKADGTEKEVDMMSDRRVVNYFPVEKYTVISTELQGPNYRTFFILPNEGFTIDDVMTSFHPYTLRMQSHASVLLQIPKFELRDATLLNAEMVVGLDAANGTVSDWATDPQATNLVRQNCFISVNENGVSDGTDVENKPSDEWRYGKKLGTFSLDRPFVFGVTFCVDHLLLLGYYGY